jgi:hypothetical protein
MIEIVLPITIFSFISYIVIIIPIFMLSFCKYQDCFNVSIGKITKYKVLLYYILYLIFFIGINILTLYMVIYKNMYYGVIIIFVWISIPAILDIIFYCNTNIKKKLSFEFYIKRIKLHGFILIITTLIVSVLTLSIMHILKHRNIIDLYFSQSKSLDVNLDIKNKNINCNYLNNNFKDIYNNIINHNINNKYTYGFLNCKISI